MIGASFEGTGAIGEDDAGMRVALTVEESGDVTVEEFLFELVDGLFLFFGFVEFDEIVASEDNDVESDGKEKAELNEFIPTLEQVRHRQVEAYHRGKQ